MQQSNEKQSTKDKDKQAKEQKKGDMGTGRQQHQPNREGSKNASQQQGNKNQNKENEDPADNMGSGRRQDDN